MKWSQSHAGCVDAAIVCSSPGCPDVHPGTAPGCPFLANSGFSRSDGGGDRRVTTPRVGIDWLGRLSSAPAAGPGVAPKEVAPPTWYDVTWNPTAGCSPVGAGCDHCDAMRTVAQLARMGGKGGARYAGLTTTGRSGVEWTGELRLREDLLTWPLLQRKARRILVNSLSDLFHEGLATETIDAVHAVMTVTHWHEYLVQTRRARRMRAYYADPDTPRRIAKEINQLAGKILSEPGSSPGIAGIDAIGPVSNPNARRRWAAGLARAVRPDAGVLRAGIGCRDD